MWPRELTVAVLLSLTAHLTGTGGNIPVAEDAHPQRIHSSSVKHHGFHHHDHHHHHWGPFFEDEGNSTIGRPGFSSGGVYAVAVPVGDMVHLNCRVAMLHDKVVMWLKKTADRASLLTVGNAAYSGDPRFQLKFQYPNNWRLQISPVLKGDDGLYMCQVSTHPPKVLSTNLTVLSPEIKVVDEQGYSVSDRYYKTGSTIELTCRAVTSVLMDHRLPNKLHWIKDEKPLTIKVKTSTNREGEAITTLSRLYIPKADKNDSGSYSCFLSKHAQAVVNVHVLNGENQAAVHYENSGSHFNSSDLLKTLRIFSLLVLLTFFSVQNSIIEVV